jgi:hypothetical protein
MAKRRTHIEQELDAATNAKGPRDPRKICECGARPIIRYGTSDARIFRGGIESVATAEGAVITRPRGEPFYRCPNPECRRSYYIPRYADEGDRKVAEDCPWDEKDLADAD